MSTIVGIHGREILDSRGNPTIEVEVALECGVIGRAAVPSGASTGTFEAVELRDGGSRYMGKGVLKAVENVNERIASEVVGMDVSEQSYIDGSMIDLDGTPNKGALGANAILGVSLAVARAASDYYDMPLWGYIGGLGPFTLPTPMMNVINGGAHADNNLDIQEFMVMPYGASSFSEALRMNVEIYHTLKKMLKEKGYSTSLGDEGGFAPNLGSNREGFDILVDAIGKAGYTPGDQVGIAVDVAASELFSDGVYSFKGEGKSFSAEDLNGYYEGLCRDYPIVSIEDGMAEEDWEGFALMTETLGDKIQIVGDDLFVTNRDRLSKGIEMNSANSILIKLNQIGTLTETLEVIRTAKNAGFSTVISHRSGETSDTFISDLSVAVSAGQIKTGAPARTDRVAKYNQLLRIEEAIGCCTPYAGSSSIRGLKVRR
jgi:enolase